MAKLKCGCLPGISTLSKRILLSNPTDIHILNNSFVACTDGELHSVLKTDVALVL